jgi:hypothetical protein
MIFDASLVRSKDWLKEIERCIRQQQQQRQQTNTTTESSCGCCLHISVRCRLNIPFQLCDQKSFPSYPFALYS